MSERPAGIHRFESLQVGDRKVVPEFRSQEEMLDVKVRLGTLRPVPVTRDCLRYGNRPVAVTVLGSVPVTGSC